MTQRPIRVLLAKPGLDGHDRGVKVLALGLRDQGMEVIYTGLRQTPEQIARAAIEEGVDVVGLSSLSGGHNVYFPRVVECLMKEKTDVLIVGGGIIPEEDRAFLKEKGVKAIFGPGTPIKDIVKFIRENAGRDNHGTPGSRQAPGEEQKQEKNT
ncbi:MAG: cobalamin B12-binding domain-containing protein [Deltaproteobacteria bacterium]|nr:cobalamin B12-binding domain-containing protein [Deltaproteobacteria bacterium]